MTVKTNDLVHVVFFGGAFWGHARSAVHYSATLCIHSPNLVISMLLPENLITKATDGIDLVLAEATSDTALAKDVRARLNFVTLVPPADFECPPLFADSPVRPFADASAAFRVSWKQIHEEPHELPRPSMLIVDMFTEYEREDVKSINDVPIIFWCSSSFNYTVYHYGPEGSGGIGPILLKALDTISDSKELDQAHEDAWTSTSSELASTGDVRPLHQYEHICSGMPAMPGMGTLMRTGTSNVFKKVDGYIATSGSWLEPEARKIVQSYFDKTLKKPTYCANLAITADGADAVYPPERIAALSPPEKEILTFLDDALAKHGAESVLYLSWGTNFAPFTAPWQADVFIDVMVEHKRPFVMSEATMGAIMNPGLEERIHKARAAGLCASAAWVPQEAVLKHKALGAFITHGGWNSTCEAIASATPMIFWPFAIDQPFTASLFSEGTEPAGWQLFETRGPSVSKFCPSYFDDGPKTSARGEAIPVPTGTAEALRAEFERVLIREAAAGSPELKKRKESMLALRERFIESTRPGGESHQSISDLSSSRQTILSMVVNDLVHVVFFGGAFWGHARSAVHYAATLCIHSPNLAISLLLPADLIVKANGILDRALVQDTSGIGEAEDVRARLRLVTLTPPEDYECPPELLDSMVRPPHGAAIALRIYWERIHEEPQELPRPSMLILDICIDYEGDHFKSINDVPILIWWSLNFNFFVYLFGPEGSGGIGPSVLKNLQTISDQKELDQAQEDLWCSTSSDLARTGDGPPLYQYEHCCSRMPAPPGAGATNVFKQADGHIIASGSWLEPGSHKIVQSYFDKILKKPTYCANLRVSTNTDTFLALERLSALSPPEKEIISFLDDALDKYGPESVLYLSWGTLMAPFMNPWQADVFIDVMIENKRPFVMSQATVNMIMNPGLEERFEKARKAGLCATAAWVPQEAVLQHKALGAFITHAGWNSTCEAIVSATPMIFWPFFFDQPFIASQFSGGSEPVGWQLYETRGPSLPEFRPYPFHDGPMTSGLGETIPVPTGTPEALRAEFERVLIREAAAGSPELKKRKERMLALRDRFIESTKPGGESYQSISDVLTPIGCTIRA
ncbi:unnamed protein product [Tilletia caries]|uniref:UDP-glycosyltransferases domain-containing protein n=1 Tax=Tilletia caries TaxID=13290 RepID=A0ABN7J169_9BASI|nr:unnamed protein product [Tilletia caries]